VRSDPKWSPSVTPSLGVILPPDLPARELLRYVQRAERLGFDELWVVEDCFLRGGIAQTALALATTSRIRVGVGILPAGARNAAFACLEIATLAEQFPHRLIVGVGHGMPGWMRQVGAWPASPLGLLGEYVTAVKDLLAGKNVTTTGAHVRLRDVKLGLPPGWVPPVYAGVRGRKSLALSGRVADGTILAEPVTPEYLRVARELIGKPRAEHRIVAYAVAAVDDSAAKARDVARSGLSWIGEPDWAPHLAPLPFAAEFARLRAEAGSRKEFAARLPDDWVDQLAVVGTPSAARARVAQLGDAGADHIVLSPAGLTSAEQLDPLARILG
jgi:5,10-methylenetetrahydromethanopterin reductase